MSEKDTIKELFSDKLNGLESEVRPELWGNISSQLGNTAAASGMSVLTKIVLGVTAAASVALVSYFVLNNQEGAQKPAVSTEKSPEKNNVKELKTSSENQQTAQQNDPILSQDFLQEITQEESSPISFDPTTPLIIHDPVQLVPPDDYQPEVSVEKQNVVTSEKTQVNTEPLVEQVLVESSSALELTLPNTFTPNGDGVNETLQLNIPEDKLTAGTFSFVVIDRMGKTVYQTTDVLFQWDGVSMNGDVVPTGDYVYYVTARDTDGKLITKYSTLHIAR
jgi:gliding motility-associated-like protein